MTLSWMAPIDSGGVDISSYNVIYFPGYQVGSVYEIIVASVTSTSNGLLSTKVTNLIANTSYGFVVMATNDVTACFDVSTFFKYSITYATTLRVSIPDIPHGLRVDPSTGGMQTISWTPSEDAGGDIFLAYLLFSDTGSILWNSTQPKFNRGGLMPNTSYGYAVVAWNSAGTSLMTTSVFKTTNESATTPGAPISLQVIARTGGSIQLQWISPIDTGGVSLSGYSLFRDGLPVSKSSILETTFLDDKNLAANANYAYTCQAFNKVGGGVTSEQLFASTSSPTPPQPPRQFAAVARGGALRSSWIAPADTGGITMRHYRIEIISDRGNSTNIITPNESLVYYGIKANTFYSVTLVAVNAIGDSDPSIISITNGNAARPAAPPAPIVMSLSSQSITLSVSMPTDNGGSPVTELNLYQDGIKVQSEDTLTGYTEFQVQQLHARTKYSFSATAASLESLGESNASVPVLVTTANATAPSDLYNFALSGQNANSLAFIWDGPDETGGDDLTFELSYTDTSTNETNIAQGFSKPFEITGLDPTTTYETQARVRNSAGVSEWTALVQAETDIAQRGEIIFPLSTLKVFENISYITVDLVRVNGTAGNVTCQIFADNSSTAINGSDYNLLIEANDTIDFAPGEDSKSFDIEIYENTVYNPVARTIVLVLEDTTARSEIVLPRTMTIYIYDDGDAGQVDFVTPILNVSEGAGVLYIPLRRTNGSSSETSVGIVASNTPMSTAEVNISFSILSKSVTFADGETQQNGSVSIIDNSVYDFPYLYFYLNLIISSGGAQLGLHQVIRINILDDGDRSKPGVVCNIHQSKATGGMFAIDWITPINVGGQDLWIINYNITVRAGSITKSVLTTDNSTQLNYNDVLALTNYTIQVAALNTIGQGNFSEEYLASTTNYTKPGEVSTITLDKATGGLLQLSITPPFDSGGSQIIGYVVYYSEKDEDSFKVSSLLGIGGLDVAKYAFYF